MTRRRLSLALALALGLWSAAAPATASDHQVEEGVVAHYPGDADTEAALVAAEDDRLTEVNTVSSLTATDATFAGTPYRLATGSAYTLVLTARSQPYTVTDLLELAPQTFVRRPDGSYLLSEHLVIDSGATLNLASPGGLILHLASDAEGFVSIVNDGGRLNIAGADGSPAVITSFDRDSERPDRNTRDGRAYLRSIGGQVSVTHGALSHLGFWSGRTAGLSLTGTDRPDAGALDDVADELQLGPVDSQAPEVEGNRNSALGDVLPAGPLPVPTVDVEAPQYSYVSAAISDTTVADSAFGLFVSGANGVDIRNSEFRGNLVSGLVMHRYVVNAVVEATTASENGLDGIQLARATTGIVLSEVVAEDNGRNGVTISGLPLATGPSATGTSVGSYGNNTLSNSHLRHNGRYGVEVIGGRNVGVLANDVIGNAVGIVARGDARDVTVVGNQVTDSATHGIALRDGVADAVVTGNIVSGGTTSVYVRGSAVRVEQNTLAGADTHAVSFVGLTEGSTLDHNKISGRGPSAVDLQRAEGLHSDGWVNDTDGWRDTTRFLVTLKKYAQPLTILWSLLAGLLIFTAVHGARSRRQRRHPYDDKVRPWDPTPVRIGGAPVAAGTPGGRHVEAEA